MNFAQDSGNVEFIISCCDSSDLMSGYLLLIIFLIFINGNILWNFHKARAK